MGDLGDGQERITLALYGGALAAIGVLLVAFLFYMQTALPLLRVLRTTLSSPPAEEVVVTAEAGNTTTIPALTTAMADTPQSAGADPATQVRRLFNATALGGALVGWALAASTLRGIDAAFGAHVALIGATFVRNDALVDPSCFHGCHPPEPAGRLVARAARLDCPADYRRVRVGEARYAIE
jgi:hypothetical protein